MDIEVMLVAIIESRVKFGRDEAGRPTLVVPPAPDTFALEDFLPALRHDRPDLWHRLWTQAPGAMLETLSTAMAACGLHAAMAREAAAEGDATTPAAGGGEARREDLPPDHEQWMLDLAQSSESAIAQADYVHALWMERIRGGVATGETAADAQSVLQVHDGLVAISAALEEFLPWDKRTDGVATLHIITQDHRVYWLGGNDAHHLDLDEVVANSLALTSGLAGPLLYPLVDIVTERMTDGTLAPAGMERIASSYDGVLAYRWRRP